MGSDAHDIDDIDPLAAYNPANTNTLVRNGLSNATPALFRVGSREIVLRMIRECVTGISVDREDLDV